MVEIAGTSEFAQWFSEEPIEEERMSVARVVDRLEVEGFTLGMPYSSQIKGSKHRHMRELRIQHHGDPYRVFYAFDPRRSADSLDRWVQGRIWALLRRDDPGGGSTVRRTFE